MTTTTPTITLEDARMKLATVEAELQGIDTDLSQIANELGRALASMRMGDKKAERKAGELSLKRAELSRSRHDTDLARTALMETIARMEADDLTTRRAETIAAYHRVTTEARALEDELARQMIAAGDTGQRLQDVAREWQRLRAEVGRMGESVGTAKVPAPAAGLFNVSTLTNPAYQVALWRRKYIDPSAPVPPRELSSYELERNHARDTINAVKAAERASHEEGVFHVIASMVTKRGGAA